MSIRDLTSKIEGAIYGLLIGDALGVPYEFSLPDHIPDPDQIEFVPPPNFARAHRSVLPGTWSDDGAQALILLHTLLSCDRFDEGHFAHGLINWYDYGFMAVKSHVFDVGIPHHPTIFNGTGGSPR